MEKKVETVLSDDEVSAGEAPRNASFTVKNLVADELRLTIGEERYGIKLLTLGDLREVVLREFDVPVYLQNFIHGGSQYGIHNSDDIKLETILGGSSWERFEHPEYEVYVWLLWMRGYDYYNIRDRNLIMRDNLTRKQEEAQRQGRPFEAVTLDGYLSIQNHLLTIQNIRDRARGRPDTYLH